VIYLLYTVHVLVCVFLILVVLLQQGKGADLSPFGGGSTQAAFGARGATTFLHKLTVASFIVFVLTTLAIGIPQFGGTGSVVKGMAAKDKAPRGAATAKVPMPPARPAGTATPVQGRTVIQAPQPSAPAAQPAAPAAKPTAPAAKSTPPPPAPAPNSGTPSH
jgi:preprotein translocase subunit SecG